MKNYHGSCLCGYIKFTIAGELSNPHVCYCTMCQQWSGAPVVAWADCDRNVFKYEHGTPKMYRSSEKTQRAFCPECGSSLFALNDGGDSICITTLLLDEKNDIVPVSESFKESAPRWMHVDFLKRTSHE